MNKLKAVIQEAKSHANKNARNTVIIVAPNILTQAYSHFVSSEKDKRSKYNYDNYCIKLESGIIHGQSDHHYDTVYIINPQDIEDRVMNEIKMIPNKGAIIYCIKVY